MADQLPLINKINQSSKHNIAEAVSTVSYGNGYEQSTVVGRNQQKDAWTLNWSVLDETDRGIMLAFWRQYGLAKSFTWTAFGDAIEKTWKISGNYSETALSGKHYRVSFNIAQVYEL